VSGHAPVLVLISLAAATANWALVPVAAELLGATSRMRWRPSFALVRWPLLALVLGAALATIQLALDRGHEGAPAHIAFVMVSLGHLVTLGVAAGLITESLRESRIGALYQDHRIMRPRRLGIAWHRAAPPESLVLAHHLRRSRGFLQPVKLALLTALGLSVVLIASSTGVDLMTLASSERGTIALAGLFATLSLVGAETTMTVWPTRQVTARLRWLTGPDRAPRSAVVVLGCYALMASPLALVLGVAAMIMRPGLWPFGLLPSTAVTAAVLLHCLSQPAIQPGGAEVLDVVSATALAALAYIPVAFVLLPTWAGTLLLICYAATLVGGACLCLARLFRVPLLSSGTWSSDTTGTR